MNVKNGLANNKSYIAPMLLITGSPGTRKNLVDSINNRTSRVNGIGSFKKTAFMGIAALNIHGYTMNSFLDVPLEMIEGSGTTKRNKPWDADRLQTFKQN